MPHIHVATLTLIFSVGFLTLWLLWNYSKWEHLSFRFLACWWSTIFSMLFLTLSFLSRSPVFGLIVTAVVFAPFVVSVLIKRANWLRHSS
jgi:hypothetical protein